jgi:hypothetical protein
MRCDASNSKHRGITTNGTGTRSTSDQQEIRFQKSIKMDVKTDVLIFLAFVLAVINLAVDPIEGRSNGQKHTNGERYISQTVSTIEQNYQSSRTTLNSKCQTMNKRRRVSRDHDVTWMRSSAFPAQIEQTTIPRARRQSSGGWKGRALYFSGIGEVLTLRSDTFPDEQTSSLPRTNFTVEVWLKPEGGQPKDVTIIGR